MRILVVCSGNICRSPMAEGILTHLCRLQRIPASVRSAGMLGIVGRPPAENAILACAERGVDIASLRSQGFSREHVAWADVVLCMERVHLEEVLHRGGAPERAVLLGRFAGGLLGDEIPDPVGQDLDAFRRTRDLLWRAAEGFFAEVEAPARASS